MRGPFLTILFSACVAVGLGLASSCSGDKDGGIKGTPKGADKDEDASGDGELADLGADEGGEEGQSLEDILKDCGVDQETLDNPDSVLFDKTLTAWPKVFVGQASAPIVGNINYRVQVYTKLKIKSTLNEMTQTTEFDIKTEPSGGMVGDTIKTEASKKTEPNRGTTTAQVMPAKERTDLMSKSPEWNGVLCTVQPVTELKTVKGGKGKLISFDPPLPMSVSPKANQKRYDAEIGSGKTWTNITAEIKSSADPAYPTGTKLTGTVSIAPADPNLTLQVSQAGGTKTFSASRAFTLRFDFGGVDKTLALGINPMQTLYMDDATHDVKIVVVDTGVQETGVVVLSDSGGPTP